MLLSLLLSLVTLGVVPEGIASVFEAILPDTVLAEIVVSGELLLAMTLLGRVVTGTVFPGIMLVC